MIMKEERILAEGSPAALIGQHVLPFVIEVHVERQALPPDLTQQLSTLQAEWVETENEHLIFPKRKASLGTVGQPWYPQTCLFVAIVAIRGTFI